VHIILVSDHLTTAKTIVLTRRHLAFAGSGFVFLVLALSSLFSYMTVRHAAEIRVPFLQDIVQAATAEQARASREFLRENLNAMAVRLGQMQAQLLRLDSMGERLAGLAGVKPQDLKAIETPKNDGRGGPLIQPAALSTDELKQAVDSLSAQLENKTDTLSLLESQLLDERIRKSALPSSLPVDMSWNASSFGWRIDPITGMRAMHEGVDFPADVGVPIRSAAAGVVVNIEDHPAYGHMVDVDHGNDLMTRYAHCSKIVVQQGALVKRGQLIAQVGSTGRATGPHLHFEIRVKGVPHNPNHFLEMARANGGRLASRQR
jgi:murein DD-endopeptidase MepM/ murein hydrolase activator NlpD